MSRRAAGWIVAIALLAPLAAVAQEGDPWTLQAMNLANGVLKAQWMDFRIEQVELLKMSQGNQPTISRLHLKSTRWVAWDPRRLADGNRLTYLVEGSRGPQAGAVGTDIEAAIDRAMSTWAAERCLRKVTMVKRPDTGEDVDIFDSAFGYGGFGNWQAADVVFGGWMPPSFFDSVTGEGGGAGVLAMSVTFIFVDSDSNPTDVDGDGYLDTAASEIYFNDGFSWQAGNGFDIETVALHELGHSLGIGHIDPRLAAVMNPAYVGPRTVLTSKDCAAVCPIWSSWPQ